MAFQFTLPCRERQAETGAPDHTPLFQFTLPCRERPTYNWVVGNIRSFNSRSRVGSDELGVAVQAHVAVSIHVPV